MAASVAKADYYNRKCDVPLQRFLENGKKRSQPIDSKHTRLGARSKKGREVSNSGGPITACLNEFEPMRVSASWHLHRVMHMRLRESKTGLTPERALQSLKRIQHHRVSIHGAPPLSGVSSTTAEHSEVFKALKIKTPSQSQQICLL
jgi:hypothetical protein